MFFRNLRTSRSILVQSRIQRIFLRNLDQQSFPPTTEKQTAVVHSPENRPAALNNLPNFLPEPTGVKSKVFDEFYLIYRFGFHQTLRCIQVIKLMQASAAFLLTPYRFYQYFQNEISLFDLEMSLILLTTATGSLFVFGWAATKAICYIYTTRECDRIILTHIDFRGRRKDLAIDGEDVVPINDIETPNSLILPFKRYSTEEKLFYSIKIGQILDRPRFNRIFSGIITKDPKDWW